MLTKEHAIKIKKQLKTKSLNADSGTLTGDDWRRTQSDAILLRLREAQRGCPLGVGYMPPTLATRCAEVRQAQSARHEI